MEEMEENNKTIAKMKENKRTEASTIQKSPNNIPHALHCLLYI